MRCRPPILLASASTVAALSLVAAGCGGSSGNHVAQLGSTTTPARNSGAAQTAVGGAVRYADCMRSNGVTSYPDPSSGGRPTSLKQINPSSPVFQTAYKACQKYAPHGEIGPPNPSPAELRFALAFAHCVRTHGFLQFPDPLTSTPDQPNFTLGAGEYFPINNTYHVESPVFRHAAKACGVQLPST